MVISSETKPLLSVQEGAAAAEKHGESTRWTRLWIVVIFSILSLVQVYGWTDSNIAWLANTANIGMLISLPFSAVLAEWGGARMPTIMCAALLVICTGLRVIPQICDAMGTPMHQNATLALNVVSMALNGLAAAWLNFAGPVFAELWYSESERALITGIMTVVPYMGVALGFIVGPLLVPSSASNASNHTNHTDHQPSFSAGMRRDQFGPDVHGGAGGDGNSGGLASALGNSSRPAIVGERELNHMLVWHAALALLCLISMVIYFPAKPAVPPSRSAASRQESHAGAGNATKATLRQAFNDLGRALCGFSSHDVRSLWVVSIVFALPLGVYSGWGAVLAINLADVADMTPIEAGWVGCLMTLLGCFGGVFVGAMSDKFAGRAKQWIVGSYVLSSAGFAVLGMLLLGIWSPGSTDFKKHAIFVSALWGGLFLNAPIPLFYEMAVEETYPNIPAGTASGVLSILITIVQIGFLAISFTGGGSSDSSAWMDWTMMLVTPVFIAPILFRELKYPRLRVDKPDLQVGKFEKLDLHSCYKRVKGEPAVM